MINKPRHSTVHRRAHSPQVINRLEPFVAAFSAKSNKILIAQILVSLSIIFTLHQFYFLTVILSHHESTSQSQNEHSLDYLNENIFYGDATGSAKILLRAAQTPRPIPDEAINATSEAERCQRYDLKYTGRKHRRRVFYGSLIADDSWHTIATTALENYGIFHTVAFSESNRTQMLYERKLRFQPGSENLKLLQSGMFGPSTKVTVDYYVNEGKKLQGLIREHAQRALILQRWKENGMTADDIGYLTDVDETFTRDFIRAMQICEVKELDHHENCKEAKVAGGSLIFEGGPLCLRSRRWFHPDLILGECIQGIGDSTKHPVPDRALDKDGWMKEGYTIKSKFSSLPENTTHYPLWNAADFRRATLKIYGFDRRGYYAGYHFHNFFPDIETLRFKYKTYGHPVEDAMEASLGSIHPDMKAMYYCSQNITNDEKGSQFSLVKGGLEGLNLTRFHNGPTPLAFDIPEYVNARMKEIKKILESEEFS